MGTFWKLSACVIAVVTYSLALWLIPFSFVSYLLGILICVCLASLLHELGHFFVYRLLKLKWKRLVFLCFVLEPGKGLRIRKDGKFFTASCVCAYDAVVPIEHYRLALLSGGLFCLVLCMVAAIACCFCEGRLWPFFLCFGIACGLNAFWNLLLPVSPDRRLLRQIQQERENHL